MGISRSFKDVILTAIDEKHKLNITTKSGATLYIWVVSMSGEGMIVARTAKKSKGDGAFFFNISDVEIIQLL